MNQFTRSDFGTPRLAGLSSNLNALTSVYRRGLRNAKRAGRMARVSGDERGMMAATNQELGLLEQATASGLQVTGIGRFEDRRDRAVAIGNELMRRGLLNEKVSGQARQFVDQAAGDDAAAPNTATSPGESFAQRAARKQREAALRGAFGRGEQEKAQNLLERQQLAEEMQEAVAGGTVPSRASSAGFLERATRLGVARENFDRVYSGAAERADTMMAATEQREDEKRKRIASRLS